MTALNVVVYAVALVLAVAAYLKVESATYWESSKR